MARDKDLERLLRMAERQGFTVEEGKHQRIVRGADGQIAGYAAKTPGTKWAVVKLRSALRKHGFEG